MLAHLHGHFVDGDLLYDDEYAALRVTPTFTFVTEQEVVSNHWPTGATWLQLPGYGVGVLAGEVLAALGVGRASALGLVPLLGVRAWAVLLVSLALAALWRSIARVGRGSASVIVAALIGGTPLLYYATEAPLRPHAWGFLVSLGFMAVWMRRDAGPPNHRAVLLGALAGLATCVRPQLALLWLLAAEDGWRASEGRARRLLLSLAAFGVWPLVHLRLQWWMYGDALTDYAGPTSHHLRAFLLSAHHGALVWCPVLALGLAAMLGAAARRQRGAWLLLGIMAAQIWVDASMRDIEPFSVLGTRTWSGGAGFGPRKLVDVLPLFLPSAVWLAERWRNKWAGPVAAALVLAACVPTALLTLAAFVSPQAVTGDVLDPQGLQRAFGFAFDGAAWSSAFTERSLPLGVPVSIALIGILPLTAGALRIASALRQMDRAGALAVGAFATLGVGVVANLWLTVLIVRSDAALIDDPPRMQRARAWMHPAHLAAVDRIEGHHARLRALVGEHAAPPSRGSAPPPVE